MNWPWTNSDENENESTTNTSDAASASPEQQTQTISQIDRSILRAKLAGLRTELDAAIRMIDKTDRPLNRDYFGELTKRWSDMMDAALNPRVQ